MDFLFEDSKTDEDISEVKNGSGDHEIDEVFGNDQYCKDNNVSCTESKSHLLMRKFSETISIPVFTNEPRPNDSLPEFLEDFPSGTSQMQLFDQWTSLTCPNRIKKIFESFRCPICCDLLVQSTVILCGHVFCSSCLNKWEKEKSICPLCSSCIGGKVRVFLLDNVVEDLVDSCDEFPIELAKKIMDAKIKRLDNLEHRNGKFIDRFRQRLDDLTMSLKYKGLLSIMKNSTVRRLQGLRYSVLSNKLQEKISKTKITPNENHKVPEECILNKFEIGISTSKKLGRIIPLCTVIAVVIIFTLISNWEPVSKFSRPYLNQLEENVPFLKDLLKSWIREDETGINNQNQNKLASSLDDESVQGIISKMAKLFYAT